MSNHPMESTDNTRRVLVVGVYLSDKPSLYRQISTELQTAKEWAVEQAWICLGTQGPEKGDLLVKRHVTERIPKFSLANQLIAEFDLNRYDYVVVCDDDIDLPDGFLDAYLRITARRGYGLSQPARTHDSYTDHYFVNQLLGIESRQTRFVEIGPVFVLAKAAYAALLPFDEASPMGWGYDFVWPVQCEQNHLAMGIVDAVPVTHKIRKPVACYSYDEANAAQHAFLAAREHLPSYKAFSILNVYHEDGTHESPPA